MNRNEKEKAFLNELHALLRKHGVEVHEIAQYDGEEEYCGSDILFTGDGVLIQIGEDMFDGPKRASYEQYGY